MQGTTSQLCLRRHNSLPTEKKSKVVLRRTHSEPNLRIEPKGLEITDANAHDIFKILNEMVSMQIPFKLLFEPEAYNASLNINKNIYKDIFEIKDDVSLNLNFRDLHPIETFSDEEKKDIYKAVGIIKSLLEPIKRDRAEVLGKHLPETIVTLHRSLSRNHPFVQEEIKRRKNVLNDTFRQMTHFFKDSKLLKLQKPVQAFSVQETQELNEILNKVIGIPVITEKQLGESLQKSSSAIQKFLKKNALSKSRIVSGKGVSFSERLKAIIIKPSENVKKVNKAIEVYTSPPPLDIMIAKGGKLDISTELDTLMGAFKAIKNYKDNSRKEISSVQEVKDIQMLMLGLTHKNVKEHLLNERVPFDTDTILPFFAEEVKESAKKLLENFEAHPDNIRRLYHYRKLLDVSPSDVAFHIVSSLKKSTVEGNIIQEASSSAPYEEKIPEIQEVIDVKGKGKAKDEK